MNETAIIAIIIAAAALLALFLIALFVCFKLTFGRLGKEADDPRRKVTLSAYDNYKHITDPLIEKAILAPCEHISIRSRDGVTLKARYYHYADGAPIEIQVHGYKGHPLRDFCSGVRDAKDRQHNLILIYQRAHGVSGGRAITFGIKERYDVLDWVNYATERFGENSRIMLLGISMGAATVIMASALPLPKTVVGIMADCPYSSPREIIKRVIKVDMHLPLAIIYPLVRLGGIVFGGFDVEAASPIEAAPKSTLPLLLIHGTEDSLIPAEMSRRIYEASASRAKERLLIPNADHALSYLEDKDTYLSAVERLMAASLSDE